MRSSSRSCPATRKSGPGWRASTAATPTTCAISMRSSIVPTSTRSTSPSRTTGTSTSVGGKEKVRKFKAADQFAPELIAFSKAILEDTEVEPDGEEGLRDVRVIVAALKSAREDRPLTLSWPAPRRRPGPSDPIYSPPVAEPHLVVGEAPTPGALES